MDMHKKFDCGRLLKHQEWLVQKYLPMVVSPDFDGLLCALMMTYYQNWRLYGFYDGKTLALSQPVNHIRELVFLDMEIYRHCVRSVGNHLLQWRTTNDGELQTKFRTGFRQTVNPNLLRGITAKEFNRKYPFGTSHFLLVILAHLFPNLQIPQSSNIKAIFLYPDGTHQSLLNYRENVIDWLDWMGVKKDQGSVSAIFESLAKISLSDLVHGLDWLSGELRKMGFKRKDDPCRFDPTKDEYQKARRLWEFLQKHTGWEIGQSLPLISWHIQFEADSRPLKPEIYKDVLLNKNPLSFALTSKAREQGFQYTTVPAELQSMTDCPPTELIKMPERHDNM